MKTICNGYNVLSGTKWSKLHCGPLISYEPTEQGCQEGSGIIDPLKVIVKLIGCSAFIMSLLFKILMIPYLDSANTEYSEKVSDKSSSEETLHNLGWTVEELSRLDQTGHRLTVEIQQVTKRGHCASDVQRLICENTSQFLKGI